MDKIISEIIIGTVILSLLLLIIPIYRDSANLITTVGECIDENEKVRKVMISKIPSENDYVSGSYIITLAKELKNNKNYSMSINTGSNLYILKNDNSENIKKIKSEMIFEVTKATIDKDTIFLSFNRQKTEIL